MPRHSQPRGLAQREPDQPRHPSAHLTEAHPRGGPLGPTKLLFDTQRYGPQWEIAHIDLFTSIVTRLTADATHDSFWPKLSPDQQTILFHRAPVGIHDTDFKQVSTWQMNADGSNQRQVLRAGTELQGNQNGWVWHGHAEWRPDGRALLITAGTATTIGVYETGLDGLLPRALTPQTWACLDGSWWPDQSGIVCSMQTNPALADAGLDVYRIGLNGVSIRICGNVVEDYDPYGRPSACDYVAWLQKGAYLPGSGHYQWDLYRANWDGSVPLNLTGLAADAPLGAINSKPCWSRDGRTIFFHRLRYGIDTGFRIWRIDPFAAFPWLTLAQIENGTAGPNEYPNL